MTKSGMMYIGEFAFDKANGEGKLKHPDCSLYVGMFKDNNRHGFGSFQSASGYMYVGEWAEDFKNGQG